MEMQPKGEDEDVPTSKVNVKVPKRVLHFSDGTLEEYSDDENDSSENSNCDTEPVDPKTLTWVPWFAYKAKVAGNSTVAAVDYVGENLAWFLGITSPKYYYEIEEAKRMEEERQKKEELKKGWVASESKEVATNQPPAANI